MTDHGMLVVHRALLAVHCGDSGELARHLHPDVAYDTGDELISGRDAVAAALSATQFEHLEMEIVPGRVEQRGDRLVAAVLTTLRWRGTGETADVSSQTLAIDVRDALIARVELLTAAPAPAD